MVCVSVFEVKFHSETAKLCLPKTTTGDHRLRKSTESTERVGSTDRRTHAVNINLQGASLIDHIRLSFGRF